ncbi:MAG: saccharopine dehydrogenase NADP-binding domain-containing protein [Acidobacteriota bacterium]|nr:saccharopine dehydrogenase NADP-binding domain-containing protein [Acidobacteriota bacterium]MDH3523579.1 saccharopine dehydrogenase NADP-binding domain-containing protein [Acidobacteriota bacterium]
MSPRYVVLGGGRQGTAAAYDLIRHGGALEVLIADADEAAARAAAARVDGLVGRRAAVARALDVRDGDAVAAVLGEYDCCLSAVPYYYNLEVARAALAARCHMCDLGGNTALVREQLTLDEAARAAGVSLIPDCGQVPGMGTSLIVRALSLLDEADEVKLWDGGLPQHPVPPWDYALTFNVAGLTNEYDGQAVFLRHGERVEVECFDRAGDELLEFPPPFGALEAFVTAGGVSTLPWTFADRLRGVENRTLRYPGHVAQWRAFRDAGLLEQEPIEVDGRPVVPRSVLHALLGPRLEAGAEIRDVVLIRVVASGRRHGAAAEAQLDLVDRFDEATGFTAMQRTTGWDLAIVAALMAGGKTPPGAVPRELSIDPALYVAELERRGFDLREEVRAAGEPPAAAQSPAGTGGGPSGM